MAGAFDEVAVGEPMDGLPVQVVSLSSGLGRSLVVPSGIGRSITEDIVG